MAYAARGRFQALNPVLLAMRRMFIASRILYGCFCRNRYACVYLPGPAEGTVAAGHGRQS